MSDTRILLTTDTEYSSGAYASGAARDVDANFAMAIGCNYRGSDTGIIHQMAVMDRAGMRGVFFVDPMPALVWGRSAIERIVYPILKAGHHVQLHCHTEWLGLASDNGLSDRTGRNLKDFPIEDQMRILAFGIDTLVACGADRPTVFRAGNYGANDDTLCALSALKIAMDSSFPAGLNGDCAIELPCGDVRPQSRHNVLEVPIAAIDTRSGLRHVQITSLSAAEMIAAAHHAVEQGWPSFVIVSHSFELFDRKRGKPNRVVQRRFAKVCEALGKMRDVDLTGGYAGLQDTSGQPPFDLLPANGVRGLARQAEQAVSNALYA